MEQKLMYQGWEIMKVLASSPDECDGCVLLDCTTFCISNIEGYKQVDEVYTCCPKSGEEFVFKFKEEL